LKAEPSVEAAILFGSSARQSSEPAPADGRSDLDLHIVTTAPAALERVDWARALPGQRLCMQVVRPATGGVRKVTAMFAAGEVDLVLVPASRLRLGRLAMRLGLHRGRPALSIALNEIATCLRSGYRFLKGEKSWGSFYARIVAEMPGVRLGDSEARVLADVFLCDLLWVLRKLERGELSAAQHLLHRSLAETNFRLLRELRLRRGQPLPSFGLGRRVEALLPAGELAWVKVDARREQVELRLAAGTALKGLQALMKELVPSWAVPTEMNLLLAPHLSPGN
jgi:hypothetical protein